MPASMVATVALSNLGKRNRNSGPRVDDMRSADEEVVRIFGTEVRAKKMHPEHGVHAVSTRVVIQTG